VVHIAQRKVIRASDIIELIYEIAVSAKDRGQPFDEEIGQGEAQE
jgi:hypothetical protein